MKPKSISIQLDKHAKPNTYKVCHHDAAGVETKKGNVSRGNLDSVIVEALIRAGVIEMGGIKMCNPPIYNIKILD